MHEFLVREIADSWRSTYKEFLRDLELKDSAVVRVGFYAIAMQIVGAEPIPEETVQEETLKFLAHSLKQAINDEEDELLTSIKFTYLDVARRREATRHGHEGRDCIFIPVKPEDWKEIS